MPRIKKPKKVKEPIRLRMKDLSDGSKSLYLDIYRNGKRTYEYLKLYLIPGTDNNTRRQNEITMAAANAIKSKRIIELRETRQERHRSNQGRYPYPERICRGKVFVGSG